MPAENSQPELSGPELAPTLSISPASEQDSGPATTDLIAATLTKPPGNKPRPANIPAGSFPLRFGDYELLREIARGGMGVVYLARQQKLNRIVALKMILAGQFASPESVKRFYLEAEAAARLDHPGIVPIYEVGEQDGHHFFSMGFVEGSSLAARLVNGPLPALEAAELMRQVSEAMAIAHAKGVIHRDLKPANVLLDQTGRPKVTDFGLAKNVESDSGLTQSGMAMGTPSYMPPEQASGNYAEIGPLSDVYSLGAMLYCLLTGRPPFQAATPVETLRQVMVADPVAPRQLNPQVPVDLETICLKCLEKEPSRRYSSAAALAEELGRFLRSEPILARPLGPAARAWRWCQRHRAIASLSAVLLISLLIGLVGTSTFAWIANGERIRANAEAATAKMKTKETALALENANEQRQRAERKLYSTGISGAYNAWLQGDARRANFHLEETDPKKRGWEYRFVDSLTHPEIRQVEVVYNSLASCVEQDLLVTCYADGVKLIKKSTGEVISNFPARVHTTSVAISQDGSWFASGDEHGFVTIRNVATARVQFHDRVHSKAVQILEFSPDGKRLLTYGDEQAVRVIAVATGDRVAELTELSGDVWRAAFSPDGSQVAVGQFDAVVQLLHLKDGITRKLKGHRASIVSITFSPDGKWLASGDQNAELLIWDLSTHDLEWRLRGHEGAVTSLGFSRDGTRLVSGGADATLRIWDVRGGQELGSIRGHSGVITHVAFRNNDRHIESAGDHSFRLWNAASDYPLTSVPSPGSLFGLAISRDGQYIASGSTQHGIAVWSTLTGQPTVTMPGHARGSWCLAMSNDGRLVASGGYDRYFRVWDAITGQELWAADGQSTGVNALAFSDDDSQLASGSSDGSIRIWEAKSGKQIAVLRGHTAMITDLDFHPEGAELASSSRDGTARTWDLATSREKIRLHGDGQFDATDDIFTVDYNSIGSQLLTAEYSHIGIWDTASGKQINRLDGHAEAVLAARYSPDDRRIFSASQDKSIKVWDAEHGEEVLTLQGHRQSVNHLALSQDQGLLVSGGPEGKIRLWRSAAVPPEKPAPKTVRPPLYEYIGPVAAVAYSPAGNLLASFDDDQAIVIRDGQTKAVTRRIENEWTTLACLAFNPKGEFILRGRSVGTSGKKLGQLALCNVLTGEEKWQLAEPLETTLSAAFSPDGSLLVTGGIDGVGRVWDAATGRLKFQLRPHSQAISAVCVSMDGKRIFTGSHDRTVMVFDAATGLHELNLFGCEAGVCSLIADPDADGIVAGCFDGTVRGWSLAIESLQKLNLRLQTPEDSLASSLVVLHGHTGPVWSLAFPAEGQLFSCGADGVLSWQAGKPTFKFTAPANQLRSFALHPTERRLATVGGDRNLREWDSQLLAGSQELAQLPGYATDMFGEQDGNQLIAVLSNNEEGAIQRIDRGGKLNDVLTIPKSAQTARFNPGGSRVALRFENEVQIWDLKIGKQLWQSRTANAATPWMGFSPSGNRLAVMLEDGSVQVWNASSGDTVATIKRKEAKYDRMSFAVDDDHILTATPEQSLQVWEIASGRLLRSFPVGAEVFGISVEPRARLVVVACFDNRIRLFDLDTGKLRWMASDHTNLPWFANFSPDGKLILSGGQDHTLRLFRADTGQQLAVVYGHQNNIPIAGFSATKPKFYSVSFVDGSLRVTDFGELKPLSEFVAKKAD